eukprot:TRINITY_DN1355_c0_g1_i1.p1 TRINITY_DN1355_c0_g1~~TRINITY_DN1355_c0_g1_i1.p1  ORF type:complete len:202 (-),score=56.81 TRINITY_DN1355_c0_g1_i1:327-908(-)
MSFLTDWFWSLLYQLGFFNKKATVLLLGLDNAGKTTLIHKLKHGTVHNFTPTKRAQNEDIILGRVTLNAWDLGGHDKAREAWSSYFFQSDAVIFMIDAADPSRFEEAREELKFLLEDEGLQDVPFLILGNKADDPNCVSREALLHSFEYALRPSSSSSSSGDATKSRPIKVFWCSVFSGEGINDAFEWLSGVL